MELTHQDEIYMKRAIELALKGRGHVNPNPLVGAVIVKNGKIIGEGYHRKYGELHAEREAIAHLTEEAAGGDMYVTLEPCCHYGKQPPCALAIIEQGIKRVFVGSDDPNALVSGGGYKLLRDAGIEVIPHVLKDECDSINQVFFHYIVEKTPYVVMKYAMTMDGKIATCKGLSKWITGEQSREYVQELRNNLMGIMVGIGTVLADNPRLTCRIPGERNPVRIVCDSNLRIPIDCNLVETAGETDTIVATVSGDKEKIKKLEELGVKVIVTKKQENQVDLKDLMIRLGSLGIDGILLEGGSRLNFSALRAGIVNEIMAFVAPKIFGGEESPTPVAGMGVEAPELAYLFKLEEADRFGDDILLKYKRR